MLKLSQLRTAVARRLKQALFLRVTGKIAKIRTRKNFMPHGSLFAGVQIAERVGQWESELNYTPGKRGGGNEVGELGLGFPPAFPLVSPRFFSSRIFLPRSTI